MQLVDEKYMRGLNCQLQFEREHAMLVLASDTALKFKVKILAYIWDMGKIQY